MLWRYDKTPWNDVEVTCKRGIRHVDSIASNEGLTPHGEGYEIDWDEIFNAGSRGDVVDLILEKFFREHFVDVDRIRPIALPHNCVHSHILVHFTLSLHSPV